MIELSAKNMKDIGLEYVFSLISPSSAYGRAALKSMPFYTSSHRDALEKEFDNLSAACSALEEHADGIKKLRHYFSQLRNIPESLKKLKNQDTLELTELFELKSLLLRFCDIYGVWRDISSSAGITELDFTDTEPALDIIDMEGMRTDGFRIPDSASERLADIRERKRALEKELARAENEDDKKSLVLERTGAAVEESEEELRICKELCGKLSVFAEDIIKNTEIAAHIDILLCKAELAEKYGCARPRIGQSRICFENMQNPHAADLLKQNNGRFTPLSIELRAGASVITGANMGGKTMALKTLTLNAVLCQLGFFPFAEAAETVLADSFYLLLDDNSAMERGLSSFGGEVAAINEAVSAAEHEICLIAIDEPARGTNPTEGAAIAAALVRHLNGKNAFSVITTHYNGIANYAGTHYQIAGLEKLRSADIETLGHSSLKERISYISKNMDYSLKKADKNAPCPHEAMNICRMMKLDENIIRYADNILTNSGVIV